MCNVSNYFSDKVSTTSAPSAPSVPFVSGSDFSIHQMLSPLPMMCNAIEAQNSHLLLLLLSRNNDNVNELIDGITSLLHLAVERGFEGALLDGCTGFSVIELLLQIIAV